MAAEARTPMVITPPMLHEAMWYVLAAPIFGYICALMAESQGRRKWLWFALGFFFTAIAAIALAVFFLRDRLTRADTPR